MGNLTVYTEKPCRFLGSPVIPRVFQRVEKFFAAVEVAAIGNNAGTGFIVKGGVLVY